MTFVKCTQTESIGAINTQVLVNMHYVFGAQNKRVGVLKINFNKYLHGHHIQEVLLHKDILECKGVLALRGKFGPLWSQKLKVAFHHFHPIGLLEDWSKCNSLAFI